MGQLLQFRRSGSYPRLHCLRQLIGLTVSTGRRHGRLLQVRRYKRPDVSVLNEQLSPLKGWLIRLSVLTCRP